MPADAYVMDADMKKVADAIRAKGGTTAPLAFPDGMATAIGNIPSGGGCGPDLTTDVFEKYYEIAENGFKDKINLISFASPYIQYILDSGFSGCTSLVSIDLPQLVQILPLAFYNCISLTTVDFPNLSYISNWSFSGCINLEYIILRYDNVAQIEEEGLEATDSFVYVPDNLVDQYKVATNWSRYADRILPISQLPP